jgi:acyl transferase domain-containing protein
MAGLIKLVLALKNQEIPPHLHLKELSPHIPWEEFPITIPTELTPWPAGNGQRIAGLSSYGFGGTNAHIVVEEAPISTFTPSEIDRSSHLLNLSAKSEQALKEQASQFEQYLASRSNESFADVCFTANTGRAHFNHRLAVVADSATQARDKLAAFAAGQTQPGIIYGNVPETDSPEVVFLFTGQGSQYVGMGRQLYETQPTFRTALDKCDALLQPYLKQSLLSVLYPEHRVHNIATRSIRQGQGPARSRIAIGGSLP